MVLVARAQASALREIDRTRSELAESASRAYVVINGVLPQDGR